MIFLPFPPIWRCICNMAALFPHVWGKCNSTPSSENALLYLLVTLLRLRNLTLKPENVSWEPLSCAWMALSPKTSDYLVFPWICQLLLLAFHSLLLNCGNYFYHFDQQRKQCQKLSTPSWRSILEIKIFFCFSFGSALSRPFNIFLSGGRRFF